MRLQTILAFIVCCVSGATAASAQWSGGYIGAHIGYGWASDEVKFSGDATYFGPQIAQGTGPSRLSPDSDGVLGGLHAGHNWTFGKAVVGIEADISWTAIDGRATFLDRFNVPAQGLSVIEHEMEWLSTVRARFGGVVASNLLVYGTAGIAFGRTRDSYEFKPYQANACIGVCSIRKATTDSGWTVGGGLEYALSPNWMWKGEYLFVSLDDRTLTYTNSVAPGGFLKISPDNDLHIIRTGLSYRF